MSLQGLKVVDFSALGPGPFASMMLADHGARVLALPRPARSLGPEAGLARGKQVLPLDLRRNGAIAFAQRLAAGADVLIESNRPGVMERLGLGPQTLQAANPGLIYVRLTGWGQDGPYAGRAGHDLNYLAVSGALGVTGLDQPVAPPALLGDLACGAFCAVIGVLLALNERTRTGRGRVVDAAIADAAAYTLTPIFGEMAAGLFSGRLGDHILSGAAPFYGSYRCADGGWFSVGAIEPQFYEAFLALIGIGPVAASQWERSAWPELRARVAEAFASKSRAHWERVFAEADACGAPVLALEEMADDPHLAARRTVVRDAQGNLSAAPAPRLLPPAAETDEHGGWRSVADAVADLGIDVQTASAFLS